VKADLLPKRRIVLGITGSIAAYKACELVRRLAEAGADTKVIMTRNATRFVGEAAMLSLSGNPVVTDMFSLHAEALPEHISLSRWAQLILIAPATANIIGKAAAGIADDLLSTTILSARCKILFAPAMNSAMYQNPIVQSNITKLQALGYEFVDPDVGPLACGDEGLGRLADISKIIEKAKSILGAPT
jgi:phosphopantothenoylcysteine decarboxylase/phosphopantothenate--cysteine ligase